MPEKVTINGYYTKSATFYYNTYIPNDVWYGFNLCDGASVSTMQEEKDVSLYFILGPVKTDFCLVF